MAKEIISRADAKAQALKRYYSGKACTHGHVGERFTAGGGCVQCIYEKNEKWRRQNLDKKNAIRRRWVEKNRDEHNKYQKEYARQYRIHNLEKKREKDRAYRKANPETGRTATKRWQNKNRETVRAANSQWYKNNPEKSQILHRRKYQKNGERIRAKNKKWIKANPEVRSALDSNRRARELNAPGQHTAADLAAILNAQKHRCAYCQSDLQIVRKHLDHIVPLAAGGSNDRANLQYTCASCNLRKPSKDPIIFAQSLGLLL